MFVLNDDLSIYVTRGDIVFFTVTVDDNGEAYIFQPGDVVRMKVYGKKDAESVFLQKDFPVTEAAESVEIYLTKKDTKFGEVISKPTDYWYEVELNPFDNPQTIIGYDEDGAKVFRLLPEGDDVEEEEITPEDIPIVDDALDMISTRPVQNQAIARAYVSLKAAVQSTGEKVKTLDSDLSMERTRLDNLISHKNTSFSKRLDYVITSPVVTDNLDCVINSDGVFATLTVNMRLANMFPNGQSSDIFIIPSECRPIDTGVIHTQFGVEFSINYDTTNNRYVLALKGVGEDLQAPTEAGTVTMTYALADYEVTDIRVGADGAIYPTAGEAVRSVDKKLDAVAAVNIDWIDGKYILNNQHTDYIANNANYECTDYIEMPPLGFSLRYTATISSGALIARFDEQKRIIDSVSVDARTTISGELTRADGCKYVRLSNIKGNTAYIWISAAANAKPSADSITGEMLANKAVTADKAGFLNHAPWTNHLREDLWIENCYVNGSEEAKGRYIKSTGMWATKPIFLEPGATYEYGGLYHGYYAFFDADGVFVSGNGVGNLSSPFTVPEGAVCGVFSANSKESAESAWIGATEAFAYVMADNVYGRPIPINSPCDYEGDDIGVFANGLCVGDSLTQGGFNCSVKGCDASHSLDYPQYAYPRKLEMISGIPITNMGVSGFTAAQWYTKHKNVDLGGYDFAIIHLGVNDAYANGGWTGESVTAFENIIGKLKAENKNIKIFVSTIPPMKSYQSAAIHSVSQGIRDFVSSMADENVILVDMAKHGHTNDSMAYNCGHLSAYGYWRLAKDFNNYISWYINKNKMQFREVQFIGSDCKYTD